MNGPDAPNGRSAPDSRNAPDSPPAADASAAPRSSWRVALLVAVAGLCVWKFGLPGSDSLLNPKAPPHPVAPRGELWSDELATIALFDGASPSVVFIRNVTVEVNPLRADLSSIRGGTGSGIVWNDEGHIVTNYHVIHVEEARAAARELEVTLANHETWAAQVVGYEVEKDIAVLKIDAPRASLKPLALGTSADLRVGQQVFAIGNPFGLDQTLTDGLISGLGREMPARFFEESRGQHIITDLIQTDAAINPGNSGGPLLDTAGRLIGMNTAIVSPSGAYSGIGFAIPADTINRIATDIIRFGQARRAGLGVTIFPDWTARRYGIDGVIVDGVLPGGSAERAGLKAAQIKGGVLADVIVGIDGAEVHGSNDLFRVLDRKTVGELVALDVRRGARILQVNVELQDVAAAAAAAGTTGSRANPDPTPRRRDIP